MVLELLLIETNVSDAEIVIQALTNVNPAIHIEVVHDGREALDYLFGTGKYAQRDLQIQPDLILLNLNLTSTPGFSGMDVLRVVKSYARTRTIPVVILSEPGSSDSMLESYQFNANSYVEKSADRERFRQSLDVIGRYWLTVNKAATKDSAQTPGANASAGSKN